MEGIVIFIVLICLIVFPTATIVVLVIAGASIVLSMCWPLLPVLAILGATASAVSSKVKEK